MKSHTDNGFYIGTKPVVFNIFNNSTSYYRRASNNWLKMHGKPMRRKPLKKIPENIVVIGRTGTGKSFCEKIAFLHKKQIIL